MDVESWQWIWLVAVVVFTVGEMAGPGSFFLLPFAVGAAVAAVLAFADVDLAFQWLAFVVLSGAFVVGLRPVARRLDQGETAEGIGAKRLIGETGTVIEVIPDHERGLVRVHREEWRAQSVDGSTVDEGTRVRVVDVKGTSLVVWPAEQQVPPAKEVEASD